MDQPLNLIILGPQGSGKGTQGELLRKKFDAAFFSAGEALREIAKENTDVGKLVHQTINVEGRLVDPRLISEVMKNKILLVPEQKSLILDSYPRALPQYELLKKFWPELGRGDYQTIYIELSEEEAVKRLTLRKRLDDSRQAIKKRLELFYSETLPMIETMEQEGRVIRINGNKSIDEVHAEILEKLNLK